MYIHTSIYITIHHYASVSGKYVCKNIKKLKIDKKVKTNLNITMTEYVFRARYKKTILRGWVTCSIICDLCFLIGRKIMMLVSDWMNPWAEVVAFLIASRLGGGGAVGGDHGSSTLLGGGDIAERRELSFHLTNFWWRAGFLCSAI